MLKTIRPLWHVHRAVASRGQRCTDPGRQPAGGAGGWTPPAALWAGGTQPCARLGWAAPSPLWVRVEVLGGGRGVWMTGDGGTPAVGRQQRCRGQDSLQPPGLGALLQGQMNSEGCGLSILAISD